MEKQLIIFLMGIVIALGFGCNPGSNNNGNETQVETEKTREKSSPKENAGAKMFDNFEDAAIYYHGIFDDDKVDEYGNIEINMGTASTGRLKLNLKDVTIESEERPEERGCADICPPRIIISFICIKGPCISDPALMDMPKNQSGSIVFMDIPKGRKAEKILKELKDLLQ
ncbi:MAG: hypothetical protein H6581_22530 [Bacteroidia bacterium]|nr:hypothetical protein [Bacteroidia bacterium]